MILLLAALIWLTWPEPAAAGPIAGALLTAIGIAATPTAVAIATFALNVLAGIGLNYLAQKLRPPTPEPTAAGQTLGGGGTVPRAFVLGRAATEGSLVYVNTYGTAGNTPNAYLVQVVALSDLPVDGLVQVYIDDEEVTFVSNGAAVAEYTTGGTDHLWLWFYDGTQVAADSNLVTLFGSDPDRPWTADMIGTGVAYGIVVARIDEELFSAFPRAKWVIDGIPLYDRREDTTAGGSGSQREATPSTWTHTRNPAVMAEAVLRGIRYDGDWVFGGQTIVTASLPFASWSSAATECDAAIPLNGGGSEPQFEAGGIVTFDTEPAALLEELAKSCNGRIYEIGGTFKMRAGAAGSSVFSLVDDDILSTDPQIFSPFPGLAETVNGIAGRYVSPADGWVAKDARPRLSATYETEDGGRRQLAEVTYGMVTSGSQVQRLMKAAVAEARRFRRHALPLPPEAFVLEPGDVLSWTSTRNGYADKLFEVLEADDTPDCDVGVHIREVDPADYDWDETVDELPVDATPVVIVRPTAQAVGSWAVAGVTVTGDDGRERAGLRLSFDTAVPDIAGLIYEVRLASSGTVVTSGQRDLALVASAGHADITEGLIADTAYESRGKLVPVSARTTSWSSWLAASTPDVRVSAGELSDQLQAEIALVTNQAAASLNSVLTQAKRIISKAAQAVLRDGIQSFRTRQARKSEMVAADTNALALIAEQATTIAEGDAALANSLVVLGVEVDANAAAVVTEATARASADSALATSITAVEATANQATASGLMKLEATSTIGGVSARFLVYLRASVGDSWRDAGFFLDILSGGTARAFFDVDQFAIGNGEDDVLPFYVSGGAVYVQNLNVSGSLIVNGTVVTEKLDDNAVSTVEDAKATSVSMPFGTAVETEIISKAITTEGGKVLIDTNFQPSSAMQTNAITADLRLYRDSTLLETFSSTTHYVNLFNWSETPSAGTYTYRLKAYYTTGVDYSYLRAQIRLTELKK